ncbi:hypothetical protein OS493_037774 [Desmophyllum pertusum]|uniref:Uncharacterized protein n=1 Tax=Desmophyllum pertusum TaxID=174260 RepID=A0A9W9YUI5_9CNID|nr:hypothetical protein OS493_037774 [Desmophyllum pertusum]
MQTAHRDYRLLYEAIHPTTATVEPSRLHIVTTVCSITYVKDWTQAVHPTVTTVEPSRLRIVTTVCIPRGHPSYSRDCQAIQTANLDYCLYSIGPSYYETFMHSGHYHYSSGQPALTDPVTTSLTHILTTRGQSSNDLEPDTDIPVRPVQLGYYSASTLEAVHLPSPYISPDDI